MLPKFVRGRKSGRKFVYDKTLIIELVEK